MKKIIGFLLGLASVCAFSACDVSALLGGTSQGSESVASESVAGESVASESENVTSESLTSENTTSESTEEETVTHKHILTRVAEKLASCTQDGNTAYYKCVCGDVFLDILGQKKTTLAEVTIAKKEHNLSYTPGIEPTCKKDGRMEYWSCSNCLKNYTDEECTEEIKLSQVVLSAEHNLTHYEGIPINGTENGVLEHWVCGTCDVYFSDAEATHKIKPEATVLVSVLGIPDFIVDVPVGHDPVVLQLTDTQLIDSAQARSPLSQTYQAHWAADRFDDLCFNYLDEIIAAANPDFIIITGDLVHGMYDDKGTSLLALIDYMESKKIPWSPIFGKHDNESAMGADWQCEQFEKAEYCVFEQKTLSGNCNYSVGLAQGGELLRVFYMLDTNAVDSPSAASLANGHTISDYCGAKPDQIAWCLEQAQQVRKYAPKAELSLACHIQPKVFEEAYFVKYGWSLQVDKPNINIDLYEGKQEGDFGYIGKKLIGGWDHDKAFFNALKDLGLDSIFVGHVHYNTASVVYEGVRLHYGVKSGEHDRVNAMNLQKGTIEERDCISDKNQYTPVVGGSIIVVSKTDGSLKNVYNHYCTDQAGIIKDGAIQWHLFPSASAKTIASRREYVIFNKQYA